jgi:hypothetical protein
MRTIGETMRVARMSSGRLDPETASQMGRKSATRRRDGLVLTREELESLTAAYALLARAAERARRKLAAIAAQTGKEGSDAAQ